MDSLANMPITAVLPTYDPIDTMTRLDQNARLNEQNERERAKFKAEYDPRKLAQEELQRELINRRNQALAIQAEIDNQTREEANLADIYNKQTQGQYYEAQAKTLPMKVLGDYKKNVAEALLKQEEAKYTGERETSLAAERMGKTYESITPKPKSKGKSNTADSDSNDFLQNQLDYGIVSAEDFQKQQQQGQRQGQEQGQVDIGNGLQNNPQLQGAQGALLNSIQALSSRKELTNGLTFQNQIDSETQLTNEAFNTQQTTRYKNDIAQQGQTEVFRATQDKDPQTGQINIDAAMPSIYRLTTLADSEQNPTQRQLYQNRLRETIVNSMPKGGQEIVDNANSIKDEEQRRAQLKGAYNTLATAGLPNLLPVYSQDILAAGFPNKYAGESDAVQDAFISAIRGKQTSIDDPILSKATTLNPYLSAARIASKNGTVPFTIEDVPGDMDAKTQDRIVISGEGGTTTRPKPTDPQEVAMFRLALRAKDKMMEQQSSSQMVQQNINQAGTQAQVSAMAQAQAQTQQQPQAQAQQQPLELPNYTDKDVNTLQVPPNAQWKDLGRGKSAVTIPLDKNAILDKFDDGKDKITIKNDENEKITFLKDEMDDVAKAEALRRVYGDKVGDKKPIFDRFEEMRDSFQKEILPKEKMTLQRLENLMDALKGGQKVTFKDKNGKLITKETRDLTGYLGRAGQIKAELEKGKNLFGLSNAESQRIVTLLNEAERMQQELLLANSKDKSGMANTAVERSAMEKAAISGDSNFDNYKAYANGLKNKIAMSENIVSIMQSLENRVLHPRHIEKAINMYIKSPDSLKYSDTISGEENKNHVTGNQFLRLMPKKKELTNQTQAQGQVTPQEQPQVQGQTQEQIQQPTEQPQTTENIQERAMEEPQIPFESGMGQQATGRPEVNPEEYNVTKIFTDMYNELPPGNEFIADVANSVVGTYGVDALSKFVQWQKGLTDEEREQMKNDYFNAREEYAKEYPKSAMVSGASGAVLGSIILNKAAGAALKGAGFALGKIPVVGEKITGALGLGAKAEKAGELGSVVEKAVPDTFGRAVKGIATGAVLAGGENVLTSTEREASNLERFKSGAIWGGAGLAIGKALGGIAKKVGQYGETVFRVAPEEEMATQWLKKGGTKEKLEELVDYAKEAVARDVPLISVIPKNDPLYQVAEEVSRYTEGQQILSKVTKDFINKAEQEVKGISSKLPTGLDQEELATTAKESIAGKYQTEYQAASKAVKEEAQGVVQKGRLQTAEDVVKMSRDEASDYATRVAQNTETPISPKVANKLTQAEELVTQAKNKLSGESDDIVQDTTKAVIDMRSANTAVREAVEEARNRVVKDVKELDKELPKGTVDSIFSDIEEQYQDTVKGALDRTRKMFTGVETAKATPSQLRAAKASNTKNMNKQISNANIEINRLETELSSAKPKDKAKIQKQIQAQEDIIKTAEEAKINFTAPKSTDQNNMRVLVEGYYQIKNDLLKNNIPPDVVDSVLNTTRQKIDDIVGKETMKNVDKLYKEGSDKIAVIAEREKPLTQLQNLFDQINKGEIDATQAQGLFKKTFGTSSEARAILGDDTFKSMQDRFIEMEKKQGIVNDIIKNIETGNSDYVRGKINNDLVNARDATSKDMFNLGETLVKANPKNRRAIANTIKEGGQAPSDTAKRAVSSYIVDVINKAPSSKKAKELLADEGIRELINDDEVYGLLQKFSQAKGSQKQLDDFIAKSQKPLEAEKMGWFGQSTILTDLADVNPRSWTRAIIRASTLGGMAGQERAAYIKLGNILFDDKTRGSAKAVDELTRIVKQIAGSDSQLMAKAPRGELNQRARDFATILLRRSDAYFGRQVRTGNKEVERERDYVRVFD